MKQSAVFAALLALAACQQNDPNNIAIDEGNSLNAEVETLPPDETVTNDGDESENSVIPVAPDAASTNDAQ